MLIPVLSMISVVHANFLLFLQYRKAKKEEKERRKKNGEKGIPKTIESMREKDETTVEEAHADDKEEIELDLKIDEMSSYFEHSYEPKVLITYSDNPNGVSKHFEILLQHSNLVAYCHLT